jgi:hypothetical protein
VNLRRHDNQLTQHRAPTGEPHESSRRTTILPYRAFSETSPIGLSPWEILQRNERSPQTAEWASALRVESLDEDTVTKLERRDRDNVRAACRSTS